MNPMLSNWWSLLKILPSFLPVKLAKSNQRIPVWLHQIIPFSPDNSWNQDRKVERLEMDNSSPEFNRDIAKKQRKRESTQKCSSLEQTCGSFSICPSLILLSKPESYTSMKRNKMLVYKTWLPSSPTNLSILHHFTSIRSFNFQYMQNLLNKKQTKEPDGFRSSIRICQKAQFICVSITTV